mmetsp:Transcript_98098/g.282989  ORF Transcript_98098/g.282989 Transcript_98098/m.282989 type:complete len:451 (-) Transcript_98098:103-1455(-)
MAAIASMAPPRAASAYAACAVALAYAAAHTAMAVVTAAAAAAAVTCAALAFHSCSAQEKVVDDPEPSAQATESQTSRRRAAPASGGSVERPVSASWSVEPFQDDGKRGWQCCGLPSLAVASRRAAARDAFEAATQRGASALQWLMAERRQHGQHRRGESDGQGSQLRCFDDGFVERTDGSGAAISLTECRCKLARRLRALAKIGEEEFFASLCLEPLVAGAARRSSVDSAAMCRCAADGCLRTSDGRLVLKRVGEQDVEVLRYMMPHLVLYLEQNEGSLLCRYLGAYTLRRSGEPPMHFVVTENTLSRPMRQVLDLSGTAEDRSSIDGKKVLMSPRDRRQILETICDDAEFLQVMGIVDYSLRLGVCQSLPQGDSARSGDVHCWLGASQDPCDLQLGIVDYLQRWTPKEAAKHWFKKWSVGCFREMQTEPPAVYCRRFCKEIVGKFLELH